MVRCVGGGQVDALDASDVTTKAAAGFPVTFNDVFGRQLSDSLTCVSPSPLSPLRS